MAISPDIESGPFIGNGAQTAFTFTFTAITPAEVAVELDGVAQSAGFTVTLANVGGTVTFASPPASGAQIVLRSSPDYLQDSTFENEGAYNLATVNTINRRQTVRALVTNKKYDALMPLAAVVDDIVTVAGMSDDVTEAASLSAGITTLAPIAANITTLAGVAGAVTSVAGIAANITTVASISANTATVAGISANVTSVAGNAANINAVGTDLALGASASFILKAPQAAIDAVAAAALAATNAGSGLLAWNSLAGYTATDVAIGATPTIGTVFASPGSLNWVTATSAVEGRLKSFSVWVMSVGNGTLQLDVLLPYNGGTNYANIGRVSITGIGSTGLKTFTAGIDYPDSIYVFDACQFAVGSAAGGVLLATQVVGGTGFTKTQNSSGYLVAKSGGSNFITFFQANISRYKSVSIEQQKTVDVAQVTDLGDGLVTDYSDSGARVFDGGGAGTTIFDTTNAPVIHDGMLTAIDYVGGTAGDALFFIIRSGAYVEGSYRKITLATGRNLATLTMPIAVKAGDLLLCVGLTGWPAQRNLGIGDADSFPVNNALFNGMTLTTAGIQRIAGFRMVVQRRRTAKEVARSVKRQRTEVLNQTFPGVTLPTGASHGQWTVVGAAGWTCNNGLVSPSAPAASWGNQYLFNDPTKAHQRSHDALVTIGDLTNIGGLVFYSQPPIVDDTFSTLVVIDAPANKGWVYQYNASTGAIYGAGTSVVLPWALAAADQVIISCRVDRDRARVDFTKRGGLSSDTASISWVYSGTTGVSGGLMRGRIGALFYSGAGGMVWKRIRSVTHWAAARGNKLFFGDSTHDLGGSEGYGRSWVKLVEDEYSHGSLLNCASGSANSATGLQSFELDFKSLMPSTAKFTGSIAATTLTITAMSYGQLSIGQVLQGPGIDMSTTITALGTGTGGVGTYTVSVAQTVASGSHRAIGQSAAEGIEVFWALGVNVNNGFGATDPNRYAAYKANTLAAAAIVTACGGKFTVVTPTPGNNVPIYVNLLVSSVLAGDLGAYEVIDVNSPRSVASPRDYGTWADLNETGPTGTTPHDGLHPFTGVGGAVEKVLADFLRARPDMWLSLS